MEYLTTYCDVIEDWPSGSPDLNPIENVWARIKARISEIGAETIDDLIQAIIDVWNCLVWKMLSKCRNYAARNEDNE
jgi:transposase